MGGNRVFTEARLPFGTLSPKDFERLCAALLAAEGHSQIRHWGDSGADKGYDLVSFDKHGSLVGTQCKRVQEFGPSKAEKEVRKVLKSPLSPPPSVYLLIASCPLSRETEERLVSTVAGAFEVMLWGLTELDQRVRKHGDLVNLFFGSATRAAVDPPLWWISAAPSDKAWAEAFAADLHSCLRQARPDAQVELGIPSDKTPWPEVNPRARWGLVVVTPEALADLRLRQIWRDTLRQPCTFGGQRRLLALPLTPAPWPSWLEERFERVDLAGNPEDYRLDLAAIISKYIGLTEKDLGDLKGPGKRRPAMDADLRQALVSWLEPRMVERMPRHFLASVLGLERKALDDFEGPVVRASAALALATGDDDPAAGALRTIRILFDELDDESEERLQELKVLEEQLENSQTSSAKSQSLLSLWLKKVVADHSRLVDHFQQRHELDLLDRVVVELEMISEPLRLDEHGEEAGRGHLWSLRKLLDLDPAEASWVTRRWVVRGDPGAGKTTLLRHLAVGEAADPSSKWVPVFQSLPVMLRDGRPLLERLEDTLGAERQGLGRVLDRAGEEGRLLLLFDGLDEVDPEVREKAEGKIRELAARWPETPIVVTTRPIGYRRFAGEFQELQLQALDLPRRREFLARWFGRFEGVRDEAKAEEALRELSDPGSEELASNPLYLTLMAMLLEDGKSPARDRATLYEQVFDLLLEGKHKLGRANRDFEPIKRPELVREILRRLAESMTLDNLDAEPRRRLEERLYLDSLDRQREELRKVRRWDGRLPLFLKDVAEKVGILGPHDGEDSDWRFWHRTFREALTAERMARWPAERLLKHARSIEGQESRWAEPFALVCGKVDDADALLRSLLEANRPLALRALATAHSVSDGTVAEILELTDDWSERSKVFERLPEMLGDADRCLKLIDRLRRGRRSGNDLYFLDLAASLVGEQWPDFADDADRLRRGMYDHIPPPEDQDLLFAWRQPDGELADLWCRIPEGTGWIGKRDDEEGDERESPRHQVSFEKPFWLSAVPVTNALYAVFDATKSFRPELADHPRVSVTWYEAVSFCRWLATQPGLAASSPTLPEEEAWEYACRAGSSTRFWSGEEEEHLAVVGWYDANSEGSAHRVGEKRSNKWGLYDVHGNVWEWTATAYDPDRYQGRSTDLPESFHASTPAADLAAHRAVRVLRGGSYWNAAQGCRSAFRLIGVPGFVIWDRGFRVLLSSAPSRPSSLDF